MRRTDESAKAIRCCLAVMLLGLLAAGEGMAYPCNEEVDLTAEAAVAGSGAAQGWLGDRYAYGLGVEQDLAEAAVWYQRAAEIRSVRVRMVGPPAPPGSKAELERRLGRRHLRTLSDMYRDGVGTPVDYSAAYRWLYVYARITHGGYAETVPTLIQEFRSLAARLTDDQVTEAKRSAWEFLNSYVWPWLG